jgi:hypothetical protein
LIDLNCIWLSIIIRLVKILIPILMHTCFACNSLFGRLEIFLSSRHHWGILLIATHCINWLLIHTDFFYWIIVCNALIIISEKISYLSCLSIIYRIIINRINSQSFFIKEKRRLINLILMFILTYVVYRYLFFATTIKIQC